METITLDSTDIDTLVIHGDNITITTKSVPQGYIFGISISIISVNISGINTSFLDISIPNAESGIYLTPAYTEVSTPVEPMVSSTIDISSLSGLIDTDTINIVFRDRVISLKTRLLS